MKKIFSLSLVFLFILTQVALANTLIVVEENGISLQVDEISVFTSPKVFDRDCSSYLVEGAPAGNYDIEIIKEGYEKIEDSIVVLINGQGNPISITEVFQMNKLTYGLEITTTDSEDNEIIPTSVEIYKGDEKVFSLIDGGMSTISLELEIGDYRIEILADTFNALEDQITITNTDNEYDATLTSGIAQLSPVEIEITKPSNLQEFEKVPIILDYTITGSHQSVWFNLNNGENITTDPLILEIIRDDLEDGLHNITVFATNNQGTESFELVEFLSFTPSIEITSPTDGASVDSSITINYEASFSPDQVWYSLDGGITNTTIASDKSGSISITKLGQSILNIFANTTLGTEVVDTVSFTINTPTTPQAPSGGGGGGGGYDTTTLNMTIDKEIDLIIGQSNQLKIAVENTKTFKVTSVKMTVNDVPDGWKITINPTSVTIDGKSHKYFTVDIDVPSDATGNKTIWFEAKSGNRIKRVKVVFNVEEKKTTPSSSSDSENEQQTEAPNTATFNATGFIAAITDVNPLYAIGVLVILIIIISMIYIYFKDIEDSEGFGILKPTKSTKTHSSNTNSPSYKSKFR
jgi:hypothetical protein